MSKNVNWTRIRETIDAEVDGLSPDDERSLLEAVIMFCESKLEGLEEEQEQQAET